MTARPSREAIEAAGQVLADVCAAQDARTPHDAAVAAFVPSGPTVAELENRIRAQRGLAPLANTA